MYNLVQSKFIQPSYAGVLSSKSFMAPYCHSELVSESQSVSPNMLSATKVQYPYSSKNYCVFNEAKVDFFVKQKEPALPYIKEILAHSDNEPQITETLYILNRMQDAGVRGIEKLYPVLSRFNNTNSPNIQTFLAGIYRKIQVPDAFGPLVAMLIRNSIHPQQACFDPNEEIGGAVLSYLSDRFRN